MCIQLLRFAIFRSCCQQAHGHTFAIASQDPTGLCSFVTSVIEFCKKPSRITFLMQVFAALRTGEVTLSYWMLQNTEQNVPEIDAAIKNWFMLSVRISSYGCTREVRRARKKRKRCSRRSLFRVVRIKAVEHHFKTN